MLVFLLPAAAGVVVNASELVTLAEPIDDLITPDAAVGCPHEEAGLLSWHVASTWADGEVPVAGSNVTIPDGVKVVVTQSLGGSPFGLITVPVSSELIFAPNASGIELHATGVRVDGALRAGAESCRLSTPLTITLHGSRPTIASTTVREPWVKGIHVTGELDLHGKRYFRTWSRLAAPVAPGQTTIWLQHAVNWEPGQSIVLVSTELKDSRDWHRNEVLTVASVQPGSPGALAATWRPVGASPRPLTTRSLPWRPLCFSHPHDCHSSTP